MPRFDHHSESFARDWREHYAAVRDADGLTRSDACGGFVVAARYDDIRKILLDSQSFVCRREVEIEGRAEPVAGGVTVPQNPFRMGMMEMDPPDSLFYRRILVPWFSAKAVAAAESHMRDLATWCLDRVIESGSMDVVDDLANPLPALITLDLLGLPMQNWRRYGVILHQAAYREKGSAKEIAWLQDDLRAVLADRREHPPEILTPIDALLAAVQDGAPLSLDIVVEMVFMLLAGGIDTSTGLIAHGIRYLAGHPDDADRLRAEPELIPTAVEELLRYYSPGTSVARTAVVDTEINGEPVRAGERIFIGIGGANSDPREFDDPERVDIAREPNRHLAFGAGLHRCLGAFLAKAEMTIVLQEVLGRLPDLRIDESGVRPYPTTPLISGFRAMPATFTPGRRVRPVRTVRSVRTGRTVHSASDADAPPPRAERLKHAAAELAVAGEPGAEDDPWHPVAQGSGTREGN
jgi:cytochrome P450